MNRLVPTSFALPLRCTAAVVLVLLPTLLAICIRSNGVVAAFAFKAPPAPERVAPIRLFQKTAVVAATKSFLSSSMEDDGESRFLDPGIGSVATKATTEERRSNRNGVLDRRTALFQTGANALTVAGLVVATTILTTPTLPALALKPKNEALCGTGFFEHIYEYKCTAIGDIQDEGYSKSLSQAESGLTDSLMGKLGAEFTGDAFNDGDSSSTPKPKKDKNKNNNNSSTQL